MAELKTKKTDASVPGFIAKVADPVQRTDAKALNALMQKVTGKKPKMWGSSIIGYDQYHYKSERSSQEGDWPMIGFSPRKQNTTIYIMGGAKKHAALLKKLGKHKVSGGSCVYIKKLADVDMKTLEQLLKAGYADMKKRYG